MVRTRVGYTGGSLPDPTYHRLGDHTEALQIDFDPDVIGYADLLAMFWSAHDCTRGHWSTQYMAAVWPADDTQLQLARESGERDAAARAGELTTRIEPLERFYRAEDYHQKYSLRRESTLVDELRDHYGSDRAMVDSTSAARLNGLLRGYGSRGKMLELLPALELSRRSQQLLLAKING